VGDKKARELFPSFLLLSSSSSHFFATTNILPFPNLALSLSSSSNRALSLNVSHFCVRVCVLHIEGKTHY
jgi:hypothetical protein